MLPKGHLALLRKLCNFGLFTHKKEENHLLTSLYLSIDLYLMFISLSNGTLLIHIFRFVDNLNKIRQVDI